MPCGSSIILLALFLVLADTAFALSHRTAAAWAPFVLSTAAMMRGQILPGRTAIGASGHGVDVGAVVFIAAVAARADLFGWPAGVGLSILAGIFLMHERSFPIPRAFLPAALGVFVAAASNPKAPYLGSLAWAT